jgi:hypothetical protein
MRYWQIYHRVLAHRDVIPNASHDARVTAVGVMFATAATDAVYVMFTSAFK